MVPYLWRRNLGLARALLAAVCLSLYIVKPMPAGLLATVPIGIYTLYSIVLAVRESLGSSVNQLSILILDLLFFFVCALHPSEEGLWLSTICYFYLLSFSTLLYDWKNVSGLVLISLAFLLVVRPERTSGIWVTVMLAGGLATIFALQKKALQDRLSSALKRSLISRADAESARESERERIAADFHDGPLQSFISFQMRLEIIRKLLTRDQEAALRELTELQDLGKSQVTELRSFVRNMQPIEANQANLNASIREIVE
ncbi:MAG: sensor histidine kinase, partial [Bryobacteraceae bacterium]